MKIILYSLVAASTLFTLCSCETTSSPSGSSPGSSGSESTTSVKPYPLSTCLVTGEGLESKGGAITLVHKGQEVKVCCKPCQAIFKKNPEVFLAKIR